MIKAIIFDYFGVISSDDYWRYIKNERWDDSIFQDFANDVNTGRMHWKEFIATVAKVTNTSADEVNHMYAAQEINPLIVSLITELHKTYKIGLLTNASHEFIDKLFTHSRLDKLFDSLVVSSRVGIIKPNPKIFQYALDQLGVKPEETIYTDDSLQHVKTALGLGIHTIHYKDFGQFKDDLAKILSQA